MTAKAFHKAVLNKKCIVWLSGKPMPAAFAANMQYWRLVGTLPSLTLYKPKKK